MDEGKIMGGISAFSNGIWRDKYRFSGTAELAADETIEDSWRRVATALASVEKEPEAWVGPFYEALEDFKFLPAGRIMAGAGTGRRVTLFNCFVMGTIPDSLDGIFDHLKEAALTMQQGGGIGYDFSTLRPLGAPVKSLGSDASGPLSFMNVWNAMCETIMSAGSRRGAMMACLRCDHPDIEAFVTAKRERGRLTNFNMSVLVTDAFMRAVAEGGDWPLMFGGVVYRTIRAAELWDAILAETYHHAEPGVIFIDRINAMNNLGYVETIAATNPCGEQPLPPYGACLLGSINLARFVLNPFTSNASIDAALLVKTIDAAVRMMDNVVDISGFPLPSQKDEAKAKRRIGLGITGLADALAMCMRRYGNEEAAACAAFWARFVNNTAYQASTELARIKGEFPAWDPVYGDRPFIRSLPPRLREDIRMAGIRNSLLTSIAPTGTISAFADNVSSGIEPIFALSYTRKIRQRDGSHKIETVEDYAVKRFRELHPGMPLPDTFVTAQDLSPADHIRMQAAVQEHVDSAISKTVNVAKDIAFADFRAVYQQAYDSGCKGCTTYRPNDVTGAVLEAVPAASPTIVAPSPLRGEGRDGGDIAASSILAEASPPPKSSPIKGEDLKGGSSGALPTRPDVLAAQVYKLKWPQIAAALYITIADIVDESGRRRPFEIFVNSKDAQHYASNLALTRMISAQFRRGGDVEFIPEELREIADPRGGAYLDGAWVPSLQAAIGGVIARHLAGLAAVVTAAVIAAAPREIVPMADSSQSCPHCLQPGLIRKEGCISCEGCGWSKC